MKRCFEVNNGCKKIPAKVSRLVFSQFSTLSTEEPWLHAQTTLAIGLLRDEKETEARPLLLRTLIQQKFNKRTIAAFLISFIPKPLARKLLAV
ncbi:MAG: hypothetical protein HC836_34010 [Richelia sp. RM2_1_2]|nr:hypothetical protein [Richelia sp. SM2_1_7]NJM21388.1 hypothetical protein [Richelia sp. SM1_7_0]NJN12106.1 hypothetical protein [Richelia sp. RM1_1_1]NJO30598.1 hypothetical protein [Richelia sp. SL_2_1]NJO63057.1 hypothetical protein [Richelia sp. RM2_1_2]